MLLITKKKKDNWYTRSIRQKMLNKQSESPVDQVIECDKQVTVIQISCFSANFADFISKLVIFVIPVNPLKRLGIWRKFEVLFEKLHA